LNEYSKTYEIRFSDIDANRHVNYAAYVDAAGDLRYRFFAEHGFPPERFEQLGISPVYTAITTQFLREVHMGETITITFAIAGLSPLGSRWRVQHDVLKSNGKKAAVVGAEGMVIDLASRRAITPTPELLQVFNRCPRTHDFEVMTEIRRLK
jgi:acyl-CoA thioester hydrolase